MGSSSRLRAVGGAVLVIIIVGLAVAVITLPLIIVKAQNDGK